MVHRGDFLKNFRLQVGTEFHRDGQDAQWASASAARFWGDEDGSIGLQLSNASELESVEGAGFGLSRHVVVDQDLGRAAEEDINGYK